MNNDDFKWERTNVQLEKEVNQNDSQLHEHLMTLLLNGNKADIHEFLKKNAHKTNIPIINECISNILRLETFDQTKYWDLIYNLITYDASLFLTTIYKNTVSRQILSACDRLKIDEIVKCSFKAKDKIRYAIGIIKFLSDQLTYDHKRYILLSCLETSSLDILKLACDAFKLPPSIVVPFLRENIDNDVALYTLYAYYHEASNRGDISDNSIVEVFSYSYISMLLLDLKKKNERCKNIAYVIEYDVFKDSKCKNKELYNLIKQNGHNGYMSYYATRLQEERLNSNRNNLVFFDKIYDFKPIGEIKNYHILFNYETNYYALMPKELCTMYKSYQIHGFIYDFDKRHKVIYASQSSVPSKYINPPIFDVNDEIEVSFSQKNGILYPQVRNLTKLFRVKVKNTCDVINYKLKYKAKILRSLNDFYYEVEVIDILNNNNVSHNNSLTIWN